MDPEEVEKAERAATIYVNAVNSSYPDAMKMAGYSADECSNRAVKMRVRRRVEKLVKEKANGDIVPAVIETSGSSEVSSIASVFSPSSTSSASTTATTATGGSSGKMPPSEKLKSAPPAAATKIRCTSKQVQKVQADKNRKDELEKIAAKEATLGYQEEKKKKNGLSAAKVCDQVNKPYGTIVHQRLVQKYVQLEKVGQSPQKCWTRVGRDVDCGSCIPFSWPRGRFRFLGLTKGDVVHNRLSSFVQ